MRFDVLAVLTSAIIGVACAGPGGMGSSGFSESQIKEACMKVEVRDAMAGSASKPAKSADEAQAYASFLCGMVAGMCSKDPSQEACQRDFKRYGLTN